MTESPMHPPRSRRWWPTGRPTTSLLVWFLLALLVSVALFGDVGVRWFRDAQGQPPVIGATEIAVTDDWFEPPVTEVVVGSLVTFVWEGDNPHDVVFEDGVGSEIMASGTYERAFDTAGEYRYRCTLHPFMEGRVEVVDAP